MQTSLAHEHNADLAVIAPHDTTAAAQQQRELVGDLLVIRDGEPRAAVRDVPYDAAQRRQRAITIYLSEIMDFVSPTVSQLTQRIPRKQTHPVLLPWLQRTAAWRQTRKIFIAPSVKPVSIVTIGVRGTCSIQRSALAAGLIKTGCNALSKLESSSDSVGCVSPDNSGIPLVEVEL